MNLNIGRRFSSNLLLSDNSWCPLLVSTDIRWLEGVDRENLESSSERPWITDSLGVWNSESNKNLDFFLTLPDLETFMVNDYYANIYDPNG